MYEKQLSALVVKNRFRKRKIYEGLDFASNDYLGLASNKELFEEAFYLTQASGVFAPTASQLVCGYKPLHKKFEQFLAKTHGFESAMLAGCGYLGNLALLGTLGRKGDVIFMDEQYHASGKEGVKLGCAKVEFFAHNNASHLQHLLDSCACEGRKIIAVEGVYSMSGIVLDPVIFDIADKYSALLIVDEAHSVGILGNRLLGVFEEFDVKPQPNHIKLGTFGKALGSYGAYILANDEIISFLENRSKPVIYSTAPSLFDTAQAFTNYRYMLKNRKSLKKRLQKRFSIVERYLGIRLRAPILMIEHSDISIQALHERLLNMGFVTGFIRPPTVQTPSLRINVALNASKDDLKKLLSILCMVNAC